jgi:hypothetical protein
VFPGLGIAIIEEVPPTLTHRDVNLDHILLDGDRPSLVDLDNFAAADPVLDLANVLAQLKSMPFRFPLTLEDSWASAAQVLAEEYFSHVPRSWRRKLPIHYAGAVLKFSVGFSDARSRTGQTRSQLCLRKPELPWRVGFGKVLSNLHRGGYAPWNKARKRPEG